MASEMEGKPGFHEWLLHKVWGAIRSLLRERDLLEICLGLFSLLALSEAAFKHSVYLGAAVTFTSLLVLLHGLYLADVSDPGRR